MKTPRDILLARHQAAQPALDRIRREVVAGLDAAPAGEASVPAALKLQRTRGFATLRDYLAELPRQLWRELIWPCRRTWAGLAAAWMVLLALNQSPGSRPGRLAMNHALPPAEIRLALRDQHQVLAEILGPAPAPPSHVEAPRPATPKPRSAVPGPDIG